VCARYFKEWEIGEEEEAESINTGPVDPENPESVPVNLTSN